MADLERAWLLLAERAEVLRAMAHPARLCILKGLMEGHECNVSKMQGCLGLPQSTVSQHLSRLRLAGIVVAQRKGTEVFYQVSPGLKTMIGEALSGMPSIMTLEG